MRRRGFRSRTARPFSRKTMLWITLLVTLLVTLQSFLFIERNLREPLMRVASIRVKQMAAEAINEAISNQVTSHSDLQQLVDWQKNDNGDVTSLMLNYVEHLKISSQIVTIVNRTLDNSVHLTEWIPVGQAFNSAILSSIGPSIPLRFESAGAPQVHLDTKVQDAGINMLLVTVFVRVTAEVMIYIPFGTKPEVVTTEIPVSYILVKGDVPMYYLDAYGRSLDSGGGIIPPAVVLPQGSAPGTAAPAP